MPKSRQPWPMKWVVLAIFLFIVPYTYLNLRYRKPGPSFEPYRDARERKRVAAAGYRRVSLRAAQSDGGSFPAGGVPVAFAPGGWPSELRSALLNVPLLPAQIGAVAAARSEEADERYPVEFSCLVSDSGERVYGAQLYVKDQSAYLIPDFERVAGGLEARSRETVIRVSIPPGSLPSGRCRLTLVGLTASKTWTVQVH